MRASMLEHPERSFTTDRKGSMDQTPQSGALAPPLFFRRIRRSIPVGVSRHAFGDHVDVRVGATVLWVGIADFEHSGRSAGFIYQVVPIVIDTAFLYFIPDTRKGRVCVTTAKCFHASSAGLDGFGNLDRKNRIAAVAWRGYGAARLEIWRWS